MKPIREKLEEQVKNAFRECGLDASGVVVERSKRPGVDFQVSPKTVIEASK